MTRGFAHKGLLLLLGALLFQTGCTQFHGMMKLPHPQGKDEKEQRFLVTRTTTYLFFVTHGFLECEKRMGSELVRCWDVSLDKVPPPAKEE